jgi:S1-C subfamily serine protease
VIISSDGYVLTNRHVIMDATSVEAKLMRQQELSSLVRRGRLKELTGVAKEAKLGRPPKVTAPAVEMKSPLRWPTARSVVAS